MLFCNYSTFNFINQPNDTKYNTTKKRTPLVQNISYSVLAKHLDLECRSTEVDALTNICIVEVSVHAVRQYKGN